MVHRVEKNHTGMQQLSTHAPIYKILGKESHAAGIKQIALHFNTSK